MASVWIDRPCDEPDDLPDVCMRCGDDTTERKRRKFRWYPLWVLATIPLGIWWILSIVLTRECRVSVPICVRHRGHWFWRGLWMFLTFFPLVFGGFGLAVGTIVLMESQGMKSSSPAGLLWIPAGILGWFTFIYVANLTAIRAGEITDRRVQMTNIHPEFAAAYEEHRGRLAARPRVSRRAAERWEDRRSRDEGRGRDDRVRRRERDDDDH